MTSPAVTKATFHLYTDQVFYPDYLDSVYNCLKKRCRLKSINHERWDLMDLWVELYLNCKFKVLSRKVYIIEAFRDDAFQKTLNGFQFSWR